jgi:hypothetical protein
MFTSQGQHQANSKPGKMHKTDRQNSYVFVYFAKLAQDKKFFTKKC